MSKFISIWVSGRAQTLELSPLTLLPLLVTSAAADALAILLNTVGTPPPIAPTPLPAARRSHGSAKDPNDDECWAIKLDDKVHTINILSKFEIVVRIKRFGVYNNKI